jgi:RHS repeat-associated protein
VSTPASLSEQVIAAPSGAGAVRAAGETFQADPYTGTGRLSVPIEVQPGPAGLAPALSLSYSTHGGNGVAGQGFDLGLAAVTRRTDRGLPSYDDASDAFALQGDELIPLGSGQYRLRTEGRFARVRHVTGRGRDYWVVTETDGTRTFYGDLPSARLADGSRIATWHPTRKQDVHGNEVLYRYTRDMDTAEVRLVEITWGGAHRIELLYERRPDPIWSSRPGFRHGVLQRLAELRVQVKRTDNGQLHTWRRYRLSYATSRWTGRSLLTQVLPSGIDASGTERTLPAMSFGYVDPVKVERRWHDLTGDVPGEPLGANLTLVRQSGSGLPDVLQTREHATTLRINLGGGKLAPPVAVAAPSQVQLSDPGVFLSDMDGDGFSDLVVNGGTRVYRAAAGGGFREPFPAPLAPSVDLTDPKVRVADLDGDGLPDALLASVGGWWFFENQGDGRWAAPVRVASVAPVRLDDPHVSLIDIDGDGIPDLVFADGSGVVVYPGLGRGSFGTPYRMSGAPQLGASFDPKALRWADLCGSGQASFVYVQGGQVLVALNQAGVALSPLLELGHLRQSSHGQVEAADFLGTGAEGLLFTDRGIATPQWRFLELFPGGQPDLLETTYNGIGGSTKLTYGSSASHWARALAAGRPWKTAMPTAQRVVDEITTQDSVTGLVLRVEYRYHHGVYDGVEREFRGFALVEQQDREAPKGDPQPLKPVVTRRWYHTGLPLDHRDEWFSTRLEAAPDQVPALRGAQRSLRGQVRREEVYAADGVSPLPYVVTTTSYQVFPVGRSVLTGELSFAPLKVQTRTFHSERTRDERIVEVNTTYDLHQGRGYGLAIEVREKGYGRLGTFSTAYEQQQAQTLERYTKTTYLSLDNPEPDDTGGLYTPHYIVGKPFVEERWGVTGSGDVLLSKLRSFYDGADYQGLGYPGSGTSPGLTKGMLSCQLELCFTTSSFSAAYPSGSGASAAVSSRGHYLQDGSESYRHAQRTRYTPKGMLAGTLDPNNHETVVSYDSTYGLFLVLVTDALSHPTTLTRGVLPFQLAVLVDANDNRTEFTYDPTGLPSARSVMGKFVSGAWQGDPLTHPTEVYEYDFGMVPIRVTTKTRQVRLGATFDAHRYIDGLGRTVQERHTAEPDPSTPSTPRFRVTGWQLYNHKGLVVRAYQPVFSGSSGYAAGDTAVPFLETLYDPLGRPIRVNHPDGTFETTDYHPWVQTARDRNDNAGALTSADPRYGAYLSTFRAHLNTPTRTYVDALGRQIAVAEDNGAGTTPTFRVTTYEIAAGAFTGTTYDLVLKQDLAPHYFVMIRGTVNNTAPTLANHGVRVTHDPFGTGDLNSVGFTNRLRLTRSASTQGDWRGTIVVWESLGDAGASGFTLVDVKTVSFAQLTSGGQPQTISATANTSWTDLSRVVLYGGPRGGGSTSASTVATMHHALHSALTPSGTNTLTGTRWRISGTFPAADFTVYVVQWGSEHLLQRVTVTGTAGGDGVDAAGEWNTATLSSPVRTANTWVWASGWTKAAGTGNSFNGVALALGDGLSVPDVASTVAVGCETSVDKSVVVTVHSHPSLLVHWLRKPDGDGTVTSYAHAVTLSGETESYDAVSNPRTTLGLRVPQHTHTVGLTSNDYAQGTWFTRHTADGTLTAGRLPTSPTAPWVAWVQSVDTVGVQSPNLASPELHVTRSVLDLKDQVLQVFDARNLGFATWTFAYDLAGQRTSAAHATGTGTRWSLSDAAGNPIWSRDARAIEVDRTFDALSRPLTEESDDGSTVKLRRKWTYVLYNGADSSSKSKNLFGRVEEQRDQDGLRYFEYDWRGLINKVSHKFWDADWQNSNWTYYSNADEAAIPSAARSSLSAWLVLTGLTDTTTVAVSTTYDAASRPIEEVWPEGTKRRWTYNAAGMAQKYEYDRGTGAGYEVAVEGATYNARGQQTGYTHGNGVVCSQEYDPSTERLTRLFARKLSPTEVRFQDLIFAYDPNGNPVQITDQLATSTFTSNQIIANTRTFRYDPRYRLVRATGKRHKNATDGIDAPVVPSPSPGDYVPYTHRYSYDAISNFTTNQEYKSGTNNLKYKTELPDLFDGYGSESYAYDANGCCTSTPRHPTLGYAFDAQPVFVDMGGNTKVRYRRHADQQTVRFVTKSGGVSALGIYLGAWEYHRREGGTAFTKTTLHVEEKHRFAQAERVLTGTDTSSLSVFHAHADHLGSAQVLTKADGTLLCQEEFFAFGRSSDRRDGRNRYRYMGVERDEDTGLSITGPRMYDSIVGRFYQADPLRYSSPGVQPFCLSKAAPLRFRDPSGYDPLPANPSGVPQGPPEAELETLVGNQQISLPPSTHGLLSGVTFDEGKVNGKEAIAIAYEEDSKAELLSGPVRVGAKGSHGEFLPGDITADKEALAARSGTHSKWAYRPEIYVHTHPGSSATPSTEDIKAVVKHAVYATPTEPPDLTAHLIIADDVDTTATIPQELGPGVEARQASLMALTPSRDAQRRPTVYQRGKLRTPTETASTLNATAQSALQAGTVNTHYYTGFVYTKGQQVVGSSFQRVSP